MRRQQRVYLRVNANGRCPRGRRERFQSRRLRAEPPRNPNCNAVIVTNPARAVSRSEKPSASPITTMPAATAPRVGTRIRTLKCNPRIVPMNTAMTKRIVMISPLLNDEPRSAILQLLKITDNIVQRMFRPSLSTFQHCWEGPRDVPSGRQIDVKVGAQGR